MSDSHIVAAEIEATLREVAEHAKKLGDGLQLAATRANPTATSLSANYLLAMAEELSTLAQEAHDLVQTSDHSLKR